MMSMELNAQERKTYEALKDFKKNSTTKEDYRLSARRLNAIGIDLPENYLNYFKVSPSVFVELEHDKAGNEYLNVITEDSETVLSTSNLDELHKFVSDRYPDHTIEATGRNMFEVFNSKSLLYDLDRVRDNYRMDLNKHINAMLEYLSFKSGEKASEINAFDLVNSFFRYIGVNPNWQAIHLMSCPAGYDAERAFVDIPIFTQALPAYSVLEKPEYHRVHGTTLGNAYWEAAQYAVTHYTMEGAPVT